MPFLRIFVSISSTLSAFCWHPQLCSSHSFPIRSMQLYYRLLSMCTWLRGDKYLASVTQRTTKHIDRFYYRLDAVNRLCESISVSLTIMIEAIGALVTISVCHSTPSRAFLFVRKSFSSPQCEWNDIQHTYITSQSKYWYVVPYKSLSTDDG